MSVKASTRTERWLSKYNETNPVKRQYVGAQVAYQFELQEKTDTAIRSVLSKSGVPTILNIPYLNFGRQIAKLTKRYTNQQLQDEIDCVMYRYLKQKLDKEILNQILDVVLDLFRQPERNSSE